MNKDSGNGILYLLIVFLVIMIFVPPLFRLLFPKEEVEQTKSLQTLECKKQEVLTGEFEGVSIDYEIKTLYSNQKISIINFKYVINSSKVIDESKVNSEFLNDIILLKDIENATLTNDKNTTNLKFNFLANNFSNEAKLQKYTENINNQKIMYENKNFICTIN